MHLSCSMLFPPLSCKENTVNDKAVAAKEKSFSKFSSIDLEFIFKAGKAELL